MILASWRRHRTGDLAMDHVGRRVMVGIRPRRRRQQRLGIRMTGSRKHCRSRPELGHTAETHHADGRAEMLHHRFLPALFFLRPTAIRPSLLDAMSIRSWASLLRASQESQFVDNRTRFLQFHRLELTAKLANTQGTDSNTRWRESLEAKRIGPARFEKVMRVAKAGCGHRRQQRSRSRVRAAPVLLQNPRRRCCHDAKDPWRQNRPGPADQELKRGARPQLQLLRSIVLVGSSRDRKRECFYGGHHVVRKPRSLPWDSCGTPRQHDSTAK